MLESWEKIIDPNYINAELIGVVGSEKIVTIKDIDMGEVFDSRTQSKLMKRVVYFDECLPLVLNKTNAKQLRSIFTSEDPAECVGKRIVLYVISVKVAGKQTTGIRIKEYTDIKCDKCGNNLKPFSGHSISEIIKISKKNFSNKTYCIECQKKIKEEMSSAK